MTLPTEGQSGHLQKHADIDTLIAGHTTQIAAGDVTNPASAAGIALSATIGQSVVGPRNPAVVTQGRYLRTIPKPVGSDTYGLRPLAMDPLVPGRMWAQQVQQPYGLGFTDDNGDTWTSKTPNPAGSGAGIPSLLFSNGYAWALQGPGSVGRDGSLWRSPAPDASGNGWAWVKVFDLASIPAEVGGVAGDKSVFRNSCVAVSGPNVYLAEYSLSAITGGPSLYYSPDSGTTWTRARQWANAKHIHAVQVFDGLPWVMLGDAGTTWSDVGLWASSAASGGVWSQRSLYGEALGGNTLYGINFLRMNVGGVPMIAAESDSHKSLGPLVYSGQNATGALHPLIPMHTVPVAYSGSQRQLTFTAEGNLMWLQTGEGGAIGALDSIMISKGPHFTEAVVLASAPSDGTFGASHGDPLENGDYVWIGHSRIRKELFVGQAAVQRGYTAPPAIVPNPTLAPDNQWKASTPAGADGTAVASWTPTLGAVALAGTGTAQPTIVTTASKKYLRFDGVDDMLSGVVGLTMPTTILIKAKLRAYGPSGDGLIGANGGGYGLVLLGGGVIKATGTLILQSAGSQFATGVDSVFYAVYNGAASSVGVDSLTPTAGDVGSIGLNEMRVGYTYAGAADRYAQLDVAEIRIYKRVLTTAQIATARAEMNA